MKIYWDLKKNFLWEGMKQDIIHFKEKCTLETYQKLIAPTHPKMEVGGDSYGFCSQITLNPGGKNTI